MAGSARGNKGSRLNPGCKPPLPCAALGVIGQVASRLLGSLANELTAIGMMKRIIVALALAFVVLQVADSFLTMWATNHGYQEVNSIVAPIAHTWWLPVCKVLPAIGVSFLMLKLARRFPKTVAFGLSAASAFLAIVLVANVFEL